MGLPSATQKKTFAENGNAVRVAFWMAEGRPICNYHGRSQHKKSPFASDKGDFLGYHLALCAKITGRILAV
jgi:hypothetical protein